MKLNFTTSSLAIPSLLVGIAALLACDFTPESFNIHQALSNLINDLHLGLIPLLLLGCTRAIYAFENNSSEDKSSYITVRSMDWSDPNMSLSLWALPSGKKRVGANKNSEGNPLTWESKYASVIVCNYGKATTDGMNEKGLVINLLFLPDAYYGEKNNPENKKPRLAVSGWGQYILDKYATVAEAVEELRNESFTIVTDTIPFLTQGEHPKCDYKNILLHLSISDATGDSAILQYIKIDNQSKLEIYHNRKYKAVTNSLYENQLKILQEFEDKGWNTQEFSWDALKTKKKTENSEGKVVEVEVKEMTPPMNGADIRFIRASFYSAHLQAINEHSRAILVEGTKDFFKESWSYEEGIAGAFSLIRNLSTPLNVKTLDNPYLSSTLWRTVSDQKNKRLFLETTRSIYPIYVDLPELFQKIGTTTHKLVLLEPPKVEGGKRVELQEEQMKHQRKIGKVNDDFEPTDDGFDFDPM